MPSNECARVEMTTAFFRVALNLYLLTVQRNCVSNYEAPEIMDNREVTLAQLLEPEK